MSASRPQRALRHYFSPGNLTALRELALRRTAERVDDQMLSYMREHAITGPWAAGERVIVCLDPSPAAANAVRAAKRTADGLDAELIALYVETDRHAILSEAEHGQPRRDDAAGRPTRRRGRDGAGPLGGRGDPGLRPLAQRHARRGRQVAALALVRAAPRLGGRRAGAQRLGPGRSRWRRRATRRRRPARPTGCSTCR